MPASPPDTAPDTADVAELQRLFTAQGPRALALRTSTTADRLISLQRLHTALVARRAALYAAFRADFGKPEVEVELSEIMPVLEEIQHARRHLRRWMRPQRVRATLTSLGSPAHIQRQPRGRCLIIGPWNYPVSILLGPLVSALAAGNTVILKPSEFTPAINQVLRELIAEAFSPDTVAFCEGGVATAQALLALPFDHFFFTGSTAVGRLVMQAAALHMASVTLELGGKSPAIVEASADLDAAVELLLWGKFFNAGQSCIAPDHVFVHRSLLDAFNERCRRLLARRYGSDPAASPDLAQLIHERHAAGLAELLQRAQAAGARLICGGDHDVARRYLAPTLLDCSASASPLDQVEIFGPLLPVIAYDELDDVLQRIDAGPKPLALYLWSRDRQVQRQVLARTRSGSLGLNLCMQQYTQVNLPFGGVNHSGSGSAHGLAGFRTFSHERSVLRAGPWLAVKLLFPPYSKAKLRLAQWVSRLVGRG
ncbi:aldehyde dehydrogenase family protein [Pseudomonas oryzihabitans]|uniref:aldehyde dehydrogenase family protein n=1 Tax=Pseudomonas oryzihabitans TaxID=47885 RepID=UPI0028661C23|nr:aldehyde dehydrogenase family protein [Pseudomonas psychrotolerans]MDR6676088.1 aldehyde dehydrogenase (NAD+) [Pseudomonas psychrotolerans]